MSKKTNEMLVRGGVVVLREAGALVAADSVQSLLDRTWGRRDAREEEREASPFFTRCERRLAGRAVRVTRRLLKRAGLGAHDVLAPRADVHQPSMLEQTETPTPHKMTIYIWNESNRAPASLYAAANCPGARIVVSTDPTITTDFAKGVVRYSF